jgi:hypothetical protein
MCGLKQQTNQVGGLDQAAGERNSWLKRQERATTSWTSHAAASVLADMLSALTWLHLH